MRIKLSTFVLASALLLPMAAIAAFTSFSERTVEKKGSLPTGYNSEAYSLLKKSVSKNKIYRVPTRNSEIPAGMCEVILEAHDVFENGSTGYQWLLDSNHFTYNEYFYEFSDQFFMWNYDMFDYLLPADAEASNDTEKVVMDDEYSIFVPAGIYDWLIVRPCDMGLVIPAGDFSKMDDFELLEGETYKIVMEYKDGDFGPADYSSLKVNRDLAITSLTVTGTGIGLGVEPVSVTITNNGNEPFDEFKLSYSVNGSNEVSETVNKTLNDGESTEYTFATLADLSAPGIYEITAWVDADGDILTSNNAMSVTTRNLEPVQLPYECVFADLGSSNFEKEWIILNANKDETTWTFSDWIENRNGESGVASCSGGWNETRTNDDWLISQPLDIKAGANNISFTVRTVLDTNVETFELCIGSTPDPESMEVLGSYDVASTDWLEKALDFNLQEDGIYYIAFHATSYDGYNLFIGSVKVAEGEYVGKPAIKLLNLIVPYSNCDLPSEALLGLRVENQGTAPLENYSLTLTVNNNSPITSEFNSPIEASEVADIIMKEPVDLSAVGTYDITLTLKSDDIDNSYTATIECFEPLTEFPVISNFTQQINADIWQPMKPGGWSYEAYFQDFSADEHGKEYGLLSRGMAFSHDARMKLSYAGGGWDITALAIYFGKASDSINQYEKVYEDTNVDSEAKEIEFVVPVDQSGNYSFIIADEGEEYSRSYIRLNEVNISEVLPYDISITNVDAPLSSYMPAKQLAGEGVYTVKVFNRGTETMHNVKVALLVDNNKLAESDNSSDITPQEEKVFSVSAELPAKEVGETFTVSFEATADENDDYMADNIKALPLITVTESQRSVEDIIELTYGTGTYGETLAIGNVYGFNAPADLSAIEVGLCFTEDYDKETPKTQIGVSLYSLDANGQIERCLFREEYQRGEGGLMTCDFPDMRLSPGYYYFEVEQMSTYNMGLAYEPDDNAICYQRVGDTLNRLNDTGVSLCIRGEFRNDANPLAKDAWVRKFISPKDSEGLFEKDEYIEAQVRNAGYEASSIDISLLVDGTTVGQKSIDLIGYEDTTVGFAGVDLSKPGVHSIEFVATIAGDENPENDSLEMIITSAEEVDPYVLDFESCADFAAAGDRWNPRWTTIDRNGVNTNSYWRYQHPHKGEPCGFMAFNISKTEPSAVEEPLPNFAPHSGDKFGLAFVFSSYEPGGENFTESDVWLISPKLKMGKESEFEFYVRTRELEYYDAELEPYRVLVSTTDMEPESFTVIGDDVRLASVDEWEHVIVDISEYDEQEIYVAIQYIGRPILNTCLMIDDLSVNTDLTTGVASEKIDDRISVFYDNKAQRLSVSGEKIEQIEVIRPDGVVMLSHKVNAKGNYSTDLSTLTPGLYIAMVNGNPKNVIKFVVK